MKELLHQDEDYIVWDTKENETISSGFVRRSMVLQFSYKDWRELREVVTGIEVPDEDMFVNDELLVIYDDKKSYVVRADGAVLGLDFYQRQCTLRFDIESWEHFTDVIDEVGDSYLRRV